MKRKLPYRAELAIAKGDACGLVNSLQEEVNDLLDKESQMWQQHSRALFLKCGDRNMRYFHSKAFHKFRRNQIKGLKNNSNVWCTKDSQKKDIAYEYYQSLFSTSQPTKFY